MSKLYQACPICRDKPKEVRYRCPGCQGTEFLEIGITSKQVERIAQRHRLDQGDPPVSDPYRAALDAALVAIEETIRRPMGVEPDSVGRARTLITKALEMIGEGPR